MNLSRQSYTAATICGALILTALVTSASACNEVVSWYADLKGSSETPSVSTLATGRATFVFDFQNPRATVTVDTQGLQDVVKIELHACATFTDVNGPTLATLYQSSDGPLSASLTKVLTNTDVQKLDKPHVVSMADVANVVLNDQAAVVVYTKGHPEGEIAGKIGMHKTVVYSDDPNSKFHDAHLHAQYQTPPSAAAQR